MSVLVKHLFNSSPVSLEGISLPALLENLLHSSGTAITLIICSDRATFVSQLLDHVLSDLSFVQSDDNLAHDHGTEPQDGEHIEASRSSQSDQQFAALRILQSTLYLLSVTSRTKMVFCPDSMNVLAYLGKMTAEHYVKTDRSRNNLSDQGPPLLVLVGGIAQQRQSGSYSAQGISRLMSAAISAARSGGAKLIVFEHPRARIAPPEEDDLMAEPSYDIRGGMLGGPWDQEVGMLSITTKTFGVGDIGWQGRTISIRRIVERWCVFVAAAG